MLELFYNLFDKFCDVNKFEELEMDTAFLYIALAEQALTDCIRPDMKAEWENMRSTDCDDSFTADVSGNFFPRTCCPKHKKEDKREPGLFKEEFRCSELQSLCSKTYCCHDTTSNKLKFSSKGLNKGVLQLSGERSLEKYRKVLDDAVKIKSANRGFWTKDHTVATYEQTKQGLLYFYLKRAFEDDGIHTHTEFVDLLFIFNSLCCNCCFITI